MKKECLNTPACALLFACDTRFAPGVLVSLASVVASSDLSDFTIYLAYDAKNPLEQDFWDSVKRICEIWGIDSDKCQPLEIHLDSVAGLPAFHTGSYLNYGRLVALDQIEEPTCVYIDADTLVLNDLAELVRNFDSEAMCAAVQDEWMPTHQDDSYYSEQVDVPQGAHYFNAGVFLVRTDYWKRENMLSRSLELAKSGSFEAFMDQSLLNILFHGKTQFLSAKWNSFTHGMIVMEAEFNADKVWPSILHFVGPKKPWIEAELDVSHYIWQSLAQTIGLKEAESLIKEMRGLWGALRPKQLLGVGFFQQMVYRRRCNRRKKKLKRSEALPLRSRHLSSVKADADKYLEKHGIHPISLES